MKLKRVGVIDFRVTIRGIRNPLLKVRPKRYGDRERSLSFFLDWEIDYLNHSVLGRES